MHLRRRKTNKRTKTKANTTTKKKTNTWAIPRKNRETGEKTRYKHKSMDKYKALVFVNGFVFVFGLVKGKKTRDERQDRNTDLV